MGIRQLITGSLESRLKTLGRGLFLGGLGTVAALTLFSGTAEAGGLYANGGYGQTYSQSRYRTMSHYDSYFDYFRQREIFHNYKQRMRQRAREQRLEERIAETRSERPQIDYNGLYAGLGGESSALFATGGERRTERETRKKTQIRDNAPGQPTRTSTTAHYAGTVSRARERTTTAPERKEKEVTVTEDENNHIIYLEGRKEPIIIPKRTKKKQTRRVDVSRPVQPTRYAPPAPSRPFRPEHVKHDLEESLLGRGYVRAKGSGVLDDGILTLQEIMDNIAPDSTFLEQSLQNNVRGYIFFRSEDGTDYKIVAYLADGDQKFYDLKGKEKDLFDFFSKEKDVGREESPQRKDREVRRENPAPAAGEGKDRVEREGESSFRVTGNEEQEKTEHSYSPFSSVKRHYVSARDYEAITRHLDYVRETLDIEEDSSLDKLIQQYERHLRGEEFEGERKEVRKKVHDAIEQDIASAEKTGKKRFARLLRQNAQYARACSVTELDLRKAHLEQLLQNTGLDPELKKQVQHDATNCEVFMRIYQNYINIITRDKKGLEQDYDWFKKKDKELIDSGLEETGYTAYARFMLAVTEENRGKRIEALRNIFDRTEWLEDWCIDWLIPSVSTSKGSWTDSEGEDYYYKIDAPLRQRILQMLADDSYNQASLLRNEHTLNSAADLCNSFLRQASLRNLVEGSWITAGVDAVTDFVFKIFDREWYKITPREMKELRKLQEFIAQNPKNKDAESIRSRIEYLKKKQNVYDGLQLMDDARRNMEHNTHDGYIASLGYLNRAHDLLRGTSWESDREDLLEEVHRRASRFGVNDGNIVKTSTEIAQFSSGQEKTDYHNILLLQINDRKGDQLLQASRQFLETHPDSQYRLAVMSAIANAHYMMGNQKKFISSLEQIVSADSELESMYGRHARRLLDDRKYNPYGSFSDARSDLSWRRIGYVFGIDDGTADWRSLKEPICLATHVAAQGIDGLKSLGVGYLLSVGFRFPGAVAGDAVDNTEKINEGLHTLQDHNLSRERRAEVNYSLASEFERKKDFTRALMHYRQARLYGNEEASIAIARLQESFADARAKRKQSAEERKKLLEERIRLNEVFRFSGAEVREFPRLLGERGFNMKTEYVDGDHENGEIADARDAVIVRRTFHLDARFADGKTHRYSIPKDRFIQLLREKKIPPVFREYLARFNDPQIFSNAILELKKKDLEQYPAFASILGIDPALMDNNPDNKELERIVIGMQDLARIRFYKKEGRSFLTRYVAEPFGAAGEYETVVEEFPLRPGRAQRIRALARNIEIELMRAEADKGNAAIHQRGRFNGLFLGAGSNRGFGGANYGYILPNGSIAVAAYGGVDYKGRPFYTLNLDFSNEKDKETTREVSLQISKDWFEYEDEEDKKDGKGKIALSSITSDTDSSDIREVSYRYHGADDPRFGAKIVRIQVGDDMALTYGIDFRRNLGGKVELSFVNADNPAAKRATNKALRFMEMTGIIPNRNRTIYATLRMGAREGALDQGEMGVVLYPANIFNLQSDDGLEGVVRGINPAFFVSSHGTKGVAVGGQVSPLGIIPGLRKFPLDLYVEYNVKSKKWDVYPVFTIDYGKTMPDIHRYVPRK